MCHKSVYRDPHTPLPRGTNAVLRHSVQWLRPSPFYTRHSLWAEFRAIAAALSGRAPLVHVTYVENNLGLLGRAGRFLPFRTIGTVHQPVSWWKRQRVHPGLLSSLEALIVLSKKEQDFFETFLPGRVHRIPHGVDTDFFCPGPDHGRLKSGQDRPHCLFAGAWLRDLDTLVNVINQIARNDKDILFDLIVPRNHQADHAFLRIEKPDRLRWHADLSDTQLRDVYRGADVLLLPLIDSTANNSLLEAMACGLPVVSNLVGGVAEYTDSTFAELLPSGDVQGMAAAVRYIVGESGGARRRAARAYAERHFSWQHIAKQMADWYHGILSAAAPGM